MNLPPLLQDSVALANREDREPSVDVEQQIYEGFFSNADQDLIQHVRALPAHGNASDALIANRVIGSS